MKTKSIKWHMLDRNTGSEKEKEIVLDFEEESSGGDIFKKLAQNIDFTPLGEFAKKDPHNPYNLYTDFYYGHLIGFNANSSSFVRKINNKRYYALDLVEGISYWKILDPHTLLLIPAKYYDWAEVSANISQTLLGEYINTNSLIQECSRISSQYDTNNFVLLLPNEKIIHYGEDSEDYPKLLQDAKEIFLKDCENSYLIIDGARATKENINANLQ